MGDDVGLVLPSEKARLCVMCVMYLFRLMKVYILYIYTVVYSTGTRAARNHAESFATEKKMAHMTHTAHTPVFATEKRA